MVVQRRSEQRIVRSIELEDFDGPNWCRPVGRPPSVSFAERMIKGRITGVSVDTGVSMGYLWG